MHARLQRRRLRLRRSRKSRSTSPLTKLLRSRSAALQFDGDPRRHRRPQPIPFVARDARKARRDPASVVYSRAKRLAGSSTWARDASGRYFRRTIVDSPGAPVILGVPTTRAPAGTAQADHRAGPTAESRGAAGLLSRDCHRLGCRHGAPRRLPLGPSLAVQQMPRRPVLLDRLDGGWLVRLEDQDTVNLPCCAAAVRTRRPGCMPRPGRVATGTDCAPR
jgi:hypothetical protein